MKKFLLAMLAIVVTILVAEAVTQPTVAQGVSHIDTSAIESWDGGFSSGNIRMVGAWVDHYTDNTVYIKDETGNIWMMDDCYIDDDAFLLLWLADNGTSNVKDDTIVKVWTELH